MKTHNWIWSIIIFTSLLFAVIACSNERVLSDDKLYQPDKAVVELRLGKNFSPELTTGPIRVLAFDQMSAFVSEHNVIQVEDAALPHKIELPITQGENTNKLVLLANAGNKGDQSKIKTPLIPMIAVYNDVMVSVNETNGRLEDPIQFFYGNGEFKLLVGIGVETKLIDMKNLCSRIDVKFLNVLPNTIDSVLVYIENAGKEIGFNGVTKSTGTTGNKKFNKTQVESGAENKFLVFPSPLSPKVYADFYLKNGKVKHFSKVLTGYNLVSNKVLNLNFDLANVESSIDLFIKIFNWDGTVDETVYGILDFKLNMKQGNITNYTEADIILSCNYSPNNTFLVRYQGVPIIPVSGQANTFKLALPVTNVELANYTIKNIRLKDRDGWYEALKEEVNFDVVFNLNEIDVNVLSRKLYEDKLIKDWFRELDGTNGNFYPGTALMAQLNGEVTVFDKLVQLGLKASIIQGEQRITGIALPASYNSIPQFYVPDYISDLKYFTYFKMSNTSIDSLGLSNLPNLTIVDLSDNLYVPFLNLSGCKNLTSFNMDELALHQIYELNLSSTSIKSLPAAIVAPIAILHNLMWSNAGLTDSDVGAFITKLRHGLQILILSDNLMTVYPNATHFTSIQEYDVSGNNIVSCALSYMKKFGADSILSQRTGMNWWCP